MFRAKKEGYLFVDHRASPGMTEAEARMAGYDPQHVKGGKMFEAATLTCCHCKAVVVKNPLRTRARNSCMKCSGSYLCDLCFANTQLAEYSHMPFEKLVDLTMDGKAPVLFMKPDLDKPAQMILPPSMGGDTFQRNQASVVMTSADP